MKRRRGANQAASDYGEEGQPGARRSGIRERRMNDLTCTDLIRKLARGMGAWFHANSRLLGH